MYISSSQRTSIDLWDPTPQVEGSSTSTGVFLTNRSLRPVVVTGLTIISSQDGGGSTAFSVTNVLPLTVPSNAIVLVNVLFHPLRPGTITGTVSVTCDDPEVPQFAVPLTTSATPRSPHGVLRISPPSLDLGTIRVGKSVGQNVTLTNIGVQDIYIDDLEVVDSSPAGQFAITSHFQRQLAPGQSESVYVSCTPTMRGKLVARLSADIRSAIGTIQPFNQHVDVPLAGMAQAPVVFLADAALGGGRPPFRAPMLQHLDFGTAAPGRLAGRKFWIRNVGDAPLSVYGVESTNRGAFGNQNDSIFPAVLAPGGELEVEAGFLAPPVAGMPIYAELWIQTDDPLRPRAVLTVAGRASGQHLTLEPRELLDLGSGSPPRGSRHNGRMAIATDGVNGETLVFLKAFV